VYFLVKGKYLTDGRNCECGDNRKGNDCKHSMRVRNLFGLGVSPKVYEAPVADNVVDIASYR
jgi:hypothetical protein